MFTVVCNAPRPAAFVINVQNSDVSKLPVVSKTASHCEKLKDTDFLMRVENEISEYQHIKEMTFSDRKVHF